MSAATGSIDRSTSTIATELRKRIRGEVRSDPFSLSLYATDASSYEIQPLVVVYPRHENEIRECVHFARTHGIPIIARGAGSGLTGESLGRAIILDMNVHMARIIELDRQNQTVAVEAGVVLDSLNRSLKSYGFRFGPDPASSDRCTLGGMIANNACGARALKYGSTREHLLSARVVLSDNSVTNFREVELDGPIHGRKKNQEGLAGKVNRELPELLKKHAAVIAAKRLRAERNRSGYLLDGVLEGARFHPQRLLCASEGTLGIVTEAVLKVVPLPGETGLAAVCFASLLDAARAVPAIRETQPVACELFDALLLRLGREARPELAALLPADAGAMLAVEYEDASRAGVEARVQALAARLGQGVAHHSFRFISDPREQADFWETRRAATPLLFRRADGLQPIAFVEDACVPVDRLAEYVQKVTQVFEKYKLEYSAYAHAGHGLPHLRPFMDLRRKEHVELLEKVAGECHAIAWACDGTISGEHGEGLARSQWIEKQAGKELYAAFKEVKALFDPDGILNPNKKITSDPHLMLKNLRFGAEYRFSDGERPKPASIDPVQAANPLMFKSQTSVYAGMTVEGFATNPRTVHRHGAALLHWAGGELERETTLCNGNGHCRSTGPEVAMCPRFKYNRIEDASPRAKANILRRMMSGRQETGAFNADEVSEIMEYCFNCKRCVDECPSAVNIPKLVMEAKARHYLSNGLPLDKQFFVKLEVLCRMGRTLAPLVNTLNEWPLVRWLLEKTVGLDRRRPLPAFKTLRLRHRNTWTPQGVRPKVIFYTDLYAKYHAPEIAQAAVDILEHHGYEVLVPEVPWTNMPALSYGAVDAARSQIRAVTGALAPFAFQGIPILCSEPTAALSLSQDFLYYLDTPETRAVARHARDIGAFLWELHRRKKLKTDFQRLDARIGYLLPCHLKALGVGKPGMQLLQLIPGLQVEELDRGCCGMAGEFGLLKKNYDEAMWIGRGIFRQPRRVSPSASAACAPR